MAEWYKVNLPIRTRIEYLIIGIAELAHTWILVADKPGHYRYHKWFGSMGRIEGMLSMIDTAIRGYVWGLHCLESKARNKDG